MIVLLWLLIGVLASIIAAGIVKRSGIGHGYLFLVTGVIGAVVGGFLFSWMFTLPLNDFSFAGLIGAAFCAGLAIKAAQVITDTTV